MSVLTAIADEFPLLAAISHELGEDDDGNDLMKLRTAKRLLRDAFCSLDHTLGNCGYGSLNKRRHCRLGSRRGVVMNHA